MAGTSATAAAPDFSVAGKVVLISGGTGGIGMAFARAFAACGATPILTDLKPPPEGTPFRYETADAWQPASVSPAGEPLVKPLLYALLAALVAEQLLAFSASYHPRRAAAARVAA